MLAVRRQYLWDFEEDQSKVRSFDKQSFWEDFRDVTSFDPRREEPPLLFYPQAEKAAPLEEVPDKIFLSPRKLRALINWDVAVSNKSVIVVDLDAPDPLLLDSFRDWLAKVRKARPRGVKRRGRRGKAPNIDITADHLRKWAHYNVLAYFDLKFWTLLFRDQELTHVEAGIWLTPYDFSSDPKEWGREAHKALQEAIDSVDMLAF